MFQRTASQGIQHEARSKFRTYQLNAMDRFPYVYLCGVASGPKKERGGKNFHLPLKYADGEIVTATTYNGYRITAQNAAALPIPPLPKGWNGRDEETTRCKNFQFAVAYFGSGIPNPLSGPLSAPEMLRVP